MHQDPEHAAPAIADVGSSALGGGKVLAIGTIIERAARLGRNMLLVRIIAPDQFGIMAITLATIALFEAITEVGVAQAVIQNKRGHTPEFLNVAWWFSIARGLIVAVLGMLLARPMATFYDQPELESLLLVAPLTVVFSGLTSPRIYALQRQFRFGATMWTMQGAGVLGTIFTLALGFYLRNVWALLWGSVFEALARLVLSFILCPIRPRFRLDPESRRDLFRFTKGMAGLSVLTLLIMQGDTFVLGRVVTAQQLGLYTVAIALASFPLSIFSKVVRPLLVPIFATYQDDMRGLRLSILQLSRLLWLFGLPLATAMAVVAEPLLVLIYGRREFVEAAPAFAIYSFFTIVYMASMVTFTVYLAIARPELQRRFTLVRAVLVVLLLYPLATLWGGTGAALSLLVSMLAAMVVQLLNLRRVIGLPFGPYMRTILPGVVAAAAVAVPGIALKLIPNVPGWAEVLMAAVLGAVVWGWLIVRERSLLVALRKSRLDVDPPHPCQESAT